MKVYSLYEAKAKLSEIVRRVREHGESVTVTYRGQPAAEIRPVQRSQAERWAARLDTLAARGVVHLGRSDAAPPRATPSG